MLRELAELGIALARAAGQQALQDWNPAQGAGAPAAGLPAATHPSPCLDPLRGSSPQGEGVDDRIPVPLAGLGCDADRVRGRALDPALTFARLSRAVRQTIALEARIAAGDFAVARPPRPDRLAADPGLTDEPRLSDDPRLPTVRQVVHAAADAETRRGASKVVHRQIDERLEDLADIDPDGALSVDELMHAICDDLGIRLDLSRLPDEVLEPPPPQPACGKPPLSAPPRGAPWSGAGQADLRRESPTKLRRSGPDPP